MDYYKYIANNYDSAGFRTVERGDPHLRAISSKCPGAFIIELGCGTGSYIKKNKKNNDELFFVGLDLSNEMLEKARKKGVSNLVRCDITKGIPVCDDSVDYVVARYSFHHFENKGHVLDEVTRCLKTGGVFRIFNIDPYTNSNWWVYDIFPQIKRLDRKRFWTQKRTLNALVLRGYKVTAETFTGVEELTRDQLIERLEIRDTSQLRMVPDAEYIETVGKIERWPSERSIRGDYVFTNVIAVKVGTHEYGGITPQY